MEASAMGQPPCQEGAGDGQEACCQSSSAVAAAKAMPGEEVTVAGISLALGGAGVSPPL